MRDIQTTVMGNATADPTPRPQSDGTDSASVRIAVTGRYYNASTEDFSDRKTEFITVFARRHLARNLIESVRKGQPLIVTGRLSSSEWTGQDDTQRYSLNIQAEAIGHDLTWGTAKFVRPLRDKDTPEPDHDTGELRTDTSTEPATDTAPAEGSSEGADEDSLVTASGTPF